MYLVVVLAAIPLLLRTAAFAQCLGGSEVNPDIVTLTHPSIFNMIGSSPSCATALNGLPEIECSGRGTVIVDRNTGPTTPNLNSTSDVRMFLTWQRQTRTDFLLAIITNTMMTFTSVELYFLSYPGQSIGLPNIQLFGSANEFYNDLSGGTPINYTFSDIFTPRENTVNNVTLIFLSNPGPLNALRLQMSFTGVDNIDWFFLSEIRVCTGTTPPPSLPAIQFQSPSDGERVVPDTSSATLTSVVLNCTMSVAGVFEWRWRKDNQILQNGGRFQITTALGTRTSKLTISQLRSTDAGSYTCEVRHRSQSGYQSRTVELVLPVVGMGTPQETPSSQPGTPGTGETPGTEATPVTGGITVGATDPGNQWCLCTTAHTTTCTTTCTTTTAVASVITAILVACVSVAIHIAVCVYYSKTKKTDRTTHSAGDVNTAKTEAVYEEVSEGNEVLEMKQNRAYSSLPLQQ